MFLTTIASTSHAWSSESSGDGLHPTNEAHELFLYPLVREFVKKLL